MNDFLPETLPPVHYFLKEINNAAWFTAIRFFVGFLVVVTAFLFFKYRKNLKDKDKAGKD